MLPGGSANTRPILAHLGWPATVAIPPASRVSISEVLGVNNLSIGDDRQARTAYQDFSRASAAAAPFTSPVAHSNPRHETSAILRAWTDHLG